MSEYMPRGALLADMQARLKASPLPLVGDRVYVARVTNLPEGKYPAVMLYFPDREFEPVGKSWEWGGSATIAIEIQVQYTEETQAGAWATQAEQIGDAVLSRLFGDAAWRRLWRGPPSWRVKQYLRAEKVAVPHVGETITLNLTPLKNFESHLIAPPLAGVDVALTLAQRPDAAPPDLSLTLESEP